MVHHQTGSAHLLLMAPRYYQSIYYVLFFHTFEAHFLLTVCCLLKVYCGQIPHDMNENELIPLFERCGPIWELRLMMDPLTNLNRGFAFVTFASIEASQAAISEVIVKLFLLFEIFLIESNAFLQVEISRCCFGIAIVNC